MQEIVQLKILGEKEGMFLQNLTQITLHHIKVSHDKNIKYSHISTIL